jgi:hypothetical protein
MKISSISIASILVTGCVVALLPDASLAQSYPTNSGDSRDPFSRASAGDTSGLMQLINEAQLNGRGTRVTREAQNQQIDAATEDFRARQLKAWRERNQKNKPAAPATTPVK